MWKQLCLKDVESGFVLAEIGFVVWVETGFKLHSDGNFEPLHSTLPTGDRHLKAAGLVLYTSSNNISGTKKE